LDAGQVEIVIFLMLFTCFTISHNKQDEDVLIILVSCIVNGTLC